MAMPKGTVNSPLQQQILAALRDTDQEELSVTELYRVLYPEGPKSAGAPDMNTFRVAIERLKAKGHVVSEKKRKQVQVHGQMTTREAIADTVMDGVWTKTIIETTELVEREIVLRRMPYYRLAEEITLST
jgi:predicted transcriptional regulator